MIGIKHTFLFFYVYHVTTEIRVWVKKSLDFFFRDKSFETSSTVVTQKQYLYFLIQRIDQSFYGTSTDLASLSSSVWKKGGHPLVPASANDWESLSKLRISSNCSVFDEEHIGISETITLQSLLILKHPCLYLDLSLKQEMLTTLCMIHWATTDEIHSVTRAEVKDYNSHQVAHLLLEKTKSLSDVSFDEVSFRKEFKPTETQIDFLDSFQSSCSALGSDSTISKLLNKFALIQVSQPFEFWCVNEERWIINQLSTMENMTNIIFKETQLLLIPRIRNFIFIGLAHTSWSIMDIRPYQTILWAFDCTDFNQVSFSHLFSCCFSILMNTSAKHCWSNSFNCLSSISIHLSSPLFQRTESDSTNFNAARESSESNINQQQLRSGIPRLCHNVITSTIFRLLGLTNDNSYAHGKVSRLSLDNFSPRQEQFEVLFDFLSSDLTVLDGSKKLESTCIIHLFDHTVRALSDSFDKESDVAFLRTIILDTGNNFQDFNVLNEILNKCNHRVFQALLSKVILPLFTILNEVKSKKSDEDIALAMAYIGLLRFHIFAPATSMDPGRRPAAKVKQLDAYQLYLSSNLAAKRMEFGLSTGCFAPSDSESCAMLQECSRVHKKCLNQMKKQVERSPNAPPFLQLFREVQHFAKTVAKIDIVISLLECIRSVKSDNNNNIVSSAWEKELNWQSSASAFCSRISSHYAYYEDVTIPFLAAIRNLQDGIRCFAQFFLGKNSKLDDELLHIQDGLIQFPMGNTFEKFDPKSLDHIFNGVTNSNIVSSDRAAKQCQLLYLFSILSRMNIQVSSKGSIDPYFIQNASFIFHSIVKAWYHSEEQVEIKSSEKITDEESEECAFREQFPDHGKEFRQIIEEIEMNDEERLIDEEHISSLEISDLILSDDEVSQMCDFHHNLFSIHNHANDLCRIQSFLMSFETVSRLNPITQYSEQLQSQRMKSGAHCFAMALGSVTKNGVCFPTGLYNASLESDFHNDPNPAEVIESHQPLQTLRMRITHLLYVFPGNSLLCAVDQVVEKMLQLDLKEVSLGKMLTGLELVLRKAQEWEQHASRRVTIGPSLQKISMLVAKWRKIELKSWTTLLNARDRLHETWAKKHWMRLYSLLAIDPIETRDRASCLHSDIDWNTKESCCTSPTWVWKGMGNVPKILRTRNIAEFNYDFVELTKTLDTFLITSSIGQFSERLHMVKSFSSQLLCQCESVIHVDSQQVSLTIFLQSLSEYYEAYREIIEAKKYELRQPIETRLKDEVKLAKWDEQSYYSLAASSEKVMESK